MSTSIPTIIPPQAAESKRDRKRRETINKIEVLHDESWRNREEKFSTLYKEYHNENKAVNTQPPSSQKYLLRLYPTTLERDALLEAAEADFQYKTGQAKKMYESERESIEAQYWDAKDQVRQRLLGAIEDRRRKLREEKEGGDIVSEALLDAQVRPRPTRRMPFRNGGTPSGSGTPLPGLGQSLAPTPGDSPTDLKTNDLLMHSLLAPSLAVISSDDIISSQSTSLAVLPPANGSSSYAAAQAGKRGPRNKAGDANGEGGKEAVGAAPGTLTALAIASGQQATTTTAGTTRTSRNAAGAQGQWVLGKSLAELKKMESASTLEIESDWARVQGATGRGGRRTRGD